MAKSVLSDIKLDPVKSFFVHMLTRDIDLKDAVLDLLDNCVDGIQRTIKSSTRKTKNKPYAGFWANIRFSGNEFIIEDNCGGIPWNFRDYAFRMGRPDEFTLDKGLKTVGVYGIGMKRAIFKMGEDCVIETHAKDESYSIHITSQWLKDDKNWLLTPVSIKKSRQKGTKIKITNILPGVSSEFKRLHFYNDFYATVASHFALIINKGFKIKINNKVVTPRSIKLLFADPKNRNKRIRPYIYKANIKGVDIFLAVGFTKRIPSSKEADESNENYQSKYSAEAGWTIICNDRIIVSRDRSSITGWGLSGVPQYHPQFSAISGIVIFNSDKPELLPTTTRKEGVNGNSEIYLQVRDKMIEGMKIFTQYTNRWKTKEQIAESKKSFKYISALNMGEIERKAKMLKLKTTRDAYSGRLYKPDLPLPARKKGNVRIGFSRPSSEIQRVSKYLFDDPRKEPSAVGEKCFERVLEKTEEEAE